MNSLKAISPYAHWLLRISLASIFLYHGIGKFPAAAGLAKMMNMPIMMIYLLALMEVTGGVLILVGGFGLEWATRLAAALFMIVMAGAIFMVHWPQWGFAATKSHPMGGMEFQVETFLVALYLFIRGNDIRTTA